MKISAAIPCFNNSDGIVATIDSIRRQSVAPDEIFVIDDCSTDGSVALVKSLGVKVIAHSENMGRGAVRGRMMTEAAHEIVVCCDGGKELDRDFVKNAIVWFDDARVAAVFGCISESPGNTAAGRWQARHLYREPPLAAVHGAALATGGCALRASSVREAGGFTESLRHGEDWDLGTRLLASGNDIVCDPALRIVSHGSDTVSGVLERYWRWYTAPHGRMNLAAYLKQIVFSVKVMARADLREGDPAAALISLISPHYQFWRPRIFPG